MASLTRWVLAHRKRVVAFWTVLTIAGVIAAPAAIDAMDQKFSVPGQKAWVANQQIVKLYRSGGSETLPFIPVVTLTRGTSVTSPRVLADLEAVDRRVAR